MLGMKNKENNNNNSNINDMYTLIHSKKLTTHPLGLVSRTN